MIPNLALNDACDDILNVLRVVEAITSQEDAVSLESNFSGFGADREWDRQGKGQFLLCHCLDRQWHIEWCPTVSPQMKSNRTQRSSWSRISKDIVGSTFCRGHLKAVLQILTSPLTPTPVTASQELGYISKTQMNLK